MRKSWNADRLRKSDRPLATTAIVVALVACFLLAFALSGMDTNPLSKALAYDHTLSRPWTLFTYPFYRDFSFVIWFALACFITYQFLFGIERKLGAAGTLVFFFSVTFLGGLFYFFGIQIFGLSAILPSLNLPLEFTIFAWCLINPSAQIMLMMVLPVPTRVLMWLAVAGVVIEYGWRNPLVGFVTAVPLLLVWLYATDRIPFLRFGAVPDLTPKREAKKEKKEFDRYMDDVKRREKEREEKERLRRLFEDSISDEDTQDGQR